MKLNVLTEAGLEQLEHNIQANMKCYQKASNAWIYEFLEADHIKAFQTEVLDFKLKVCKEEVSKTDVENVKTVYGKLKFLTNEQAADDRFWTGLTHLNFWEFMYERWEVGDKGQTIDNIKGRYFIEMSTSYRRSLIVNTLSKYWWVGRKLYDQDADDPFHLLKCFESDYSTRTFKLLSSNYANNDEVIRFSIEALNELEEEIGRRMTREEFGKIAVYLNILGGINVVDYLEKDELKGRIRARFYKENKS